MARLTSFKLDVPLFAKEPNVNILFRVPDGWYLVALKKEIIDWVRNTYADKEGATWRETDDDSYILYRRRLEMTEEMTMLLKLKYNDTLDNTGI
jgi:hypothetical protein